jgi:hypothetical protein
MAYGTTLAQNSGIDARTIVAKSDSEFDDAKIDFCLNLAGLGMTEGVKESLPANFDEFFPHNGIEFLAVPTYYDVELNGGEETKLSSQCSKGVGKTLGSCSAEMKPRENIPSLSRDPVRLPQGFLK